MLEDSTTEYQLHSSTLVPMGGQLAYYKELPTGKLLDFFISFSKKDNKKGMRTQLNKRLYSKTRPGFYAQIESGLHLAYADQRDGANSPHWWRLFFNEAWKEKVEKFLNSSALSVIGSNNESGNDYAKNYSPQGNYSREWGGMYFRSKTEVKVAEELSKRNLLFFANTRGQVSRVGSPASAQSDWLTGRIEVDFLVFHKGKCISLEVDGQHHQEEVQAFRDCIRDRVLLREGISTVRFSADECFNKTSDVITEFLNIF